MGIFSNIYQAVAKFFKQQDEINAEDASKSVATNRLRLVLMQDRTNLTPKVLEQMRGELVELLSKYLEMDKDALELNFEHEGDQVALMLSIPVIRAKEESEIEIISKSDEENEEVTEDNESISEVDNEDTTDGEDVEIQDSASENTSDENQNITKPDGIGVVEKNINESEEVANEQSV